MEIQKFMLLQSLHYTGMQLILFLVEMIMVYSFQKMMDQHGKDSVQHLTELKFNLSTLS
jgi:hypothetical protein